MGLGHSRIDVSTVEVSANADTKAGKLAFAMLWSCITLHCAEDESCIVDTARNRADRIEGPSRRPNTGTIDQTIGRLEANKSCRSSRGSVGPSCIRPYRGDTVARRYCSG